MSAATVIAWIGIVLMSIWTIAYIFGTLQTIALYRKIAIEKKEPTKSITAPGCIVVTLGLLSIPLYILVLVLDFKIQVLAVLLVAIVLIVTDTILGQKKKKAKPEKSPEDIEKEVQELEKAPQRDKIFVVSAFVVFTTILRVLPFVVYLLVK